LPICRLLVDADACPVRRETERAAERFGCPLIFFANASQQLAARAGRVVVSDQSDRSDASDFLLFAECCPGDVVVTDDIGLASLALSKGARALSSRGRLYGEQDMPLLLARRHTARKARRAGERTRGPRPFTDADRRRFLRALDALLSAPFQPKEPE